MKIDIKINKKFIFVISLLIIIIGAMFFLLVPALEDLISIKSEISQKKIELAEIEDLIVRANEIKKQGRDIEKELKEVYSALPKEKDIPDLLVYFESLATNSGLILESVEFSQPDEDIDIDEGIKEENNKETKGLLESRAVKLTVSGTYNAFKKYLRKLEENIRSMNVSFINFSSRQLFIGADSDFSDFNLEVEVFYQ